MKYGSATEWYDTHIQFYFVNRLVCVSVIVFLFILINRMRMEKWTGETLQYPDFEKYVSFECLLCVFIN